MVFLFATTENDDIEIKTEFDINNAGYSGFEAADPNMQKHLSDTYRPHGRNDYQLIFIKSGIGYFKFDSGGEFTPIEANHIVLFKPREPQIYQFLCSDKSEMFWIHFGGSKTESILKECGIWDKKCFTYANGEKFIDTVNFIMDEFKQKKDMYKLNCISKLLELFVVIKRNSSALNDLTTESMQHICSIIQNNYFLDTQNLEYANICHMSVPHFLKKFKEYTGTSPQHYKITCRIKNAERMLTQSNLKITEISQITGFSNSLYFSRVFQKMKGIPPSQYRKKYKENI